MNLVLIKKEALDLVGFLSSYFIHGGADFEFGLKLKKEGGAVVLAPGYFGVCDRNRASSLDSRYARNVVAYFRARCSPKEAPPLQQFRYYLEHGGYLWLYFYARQYLTKSFLRLFLNGRWF